MTTSDARKKRECPDCDGAGYLIDYRRTGPDGDERRMDTPCVPCKGTGKATEKVCTECGADLARKGHSDPPVYVCLRPTCSKRGVEIG